MGGRDRGWSLHFNQLTKVLVMGVSAKSSTNPTHFL